MPGHRMTGRKLCPITKIVRYLGSVPIPPTRRHPHRPNLLREGRYEVTLRCGAIRSVDWVRANIGTYVNCPACTRPVTA